MVLYCPRQDSLHDNKMFYIAVSWSGLGHSKVDIENNYSKPVESTAENKGVKPFAADVWSTTHLPRAR